MKVLTTFLIIAFAWSVENPNRYLFSMRDDLVADNICIWIWIQSVLTFSTDKEVNEKTASVKQSFGKGRDTGQDGDREGDGRTATPQNAKF